jgi:hypothetical protein
MGDFGFGPSSLGDVFMRDNPASVAHGFIGNEYFTPISGGDDPLHDGALRQLGKEIIAILMRFQIEQPGRNPVLQKRAKRAPGLHDLS